MGSFRFLKKLGIGLVAAFSLMSAPAIFSQELFEGGGNVNVAELDRMYVKGLTYLAQKQAPDGKWNEPPYGADPGVVGLAVVAMLSHGDDPNTGPYAEAIRRGLDFIIKQMSPETGYIGRSMYNHGFSTLALAEAYGQVLDPRLGPSLEKATRLILSSQAKNPLGGWRYSPESSDADTTVSGAQMVALFAARNAGIAVPEEAIQRGIRFMLKCQTPEGGFGYTAATSPNGARTAIACLTLALAKDKQSAAFKQGFAYLQKAPSESSYQHYFLYYASQAYFHASPQLWNEWNRKNVKSLTSTQNEDGSWDGQFGPTFTTAASLLSVALNYRYLPIYER